MVFSLAILLNRNREGFYNNSSFINKNAVFYLLLLLDLFE